MSAAPKMLFPLAMLFAAGCDGSGSATQVRREQAGGPTARRAAIGEAPTATKPRIDTRWASTCSIPSDAPRGPIGKTADTLTATYGSPAEVDRFVLGEAVDPVRMSIRNALPSPADLTAEVQEMTWRAQACELRIWLARRGGRWVAVETMRAPQGGEH